MVKFVFSVVYLKAVALNVVKLEGSSVTYPSVEKLSLCSSALLQLLDKNMSLPSPLPPFILWLLFSCLKGGQSSAGAVC